LQDANFSSGKGVLVDSQEITVSLGSWHSAKEEKSYIPLKTNPRRGRRPRRVRKQYNPFGRAGHFESRSSEISERLVEQSAGKVTDMTLISRQKIEFSIDLDGTEATEPEDFIDDQIKALGLGDFMDESGRNPKDPST